MSILSESIFLRYLPVTFIKFLYENGKQKFLQVYKMQHYESPILIWNAELRSILENAIKEQTKEFEDEIREFAKMSSSEMKKPENFPKFNKKFKGIIKYPTIENEVRCGRYYLRVWVQQKKDSENFFKIPVEEESEFFKNLEAELRYCRYEEQLKNQNK